MKTFIIKTTEDTFKIVDIDFFKNRLKRQTSLDNIHRKNLFKDDDKKGLANFIKGVISIPFDVSDFDLAIMKSVSDENGIFLENVYQEKRKLFWGTIYDKQKLKTA
jgi:hypothetical protein